MQNILRNSILYLMSILVLVLSLGLDISKMKCDEGGVIYLGNEVPSCSLVEDISCGEEQKKVSCCIIEIEKSCCPETKDNTCASETQSIQFDFETLIVLAEYSFGKVVAISQLFRIDTLHKRQIVNFYISTIPPPKLNQPVLSEIQSFLL